MPAEQTVLVDRVRALIAEEPAVREVTMFGGRSVMVNEKMIVSARRDGRLLVRVDADRHDELLALPGAAPAKIGPVRVMGPGWIEVSAEAVRDDRQLSSWVAIAMEYNRLVTGGHPTN